MTKGGKQSLLTITYFGCILLMIAYIVFFFLGLRSDRVYNWARVCYIILSILLVIQVVFDLVCNFSGRGKYASGLFLIVLTVITVIMSFIVYGTMANRGAIPADLTDIFYLQIALSYAINILSIIIYCVGSYWGNRRLNNEH